jgi:hypothetical protein
VRGADGVRWWHEADVRPRRLGDVGVDEVTQFCWNFCELSFLVSEWERGSVYLREGATVEAIGPIKHYLGCSLCYDNSN